MSTQKVAGRTVVVGDEIYVITCDKTVPRHYVIAALMLSVMIVAQALLANSIPLGPSLYAGFIGLVTLTLAWLYEDGSRYRLQHLMDLDCVRVTQPDES